MRLRSMLIASAVVGALAAGAATSAMADTYTYVGSWFVDAGPNWYDDNPPVFSGQEAAAYIFGGAAADYAISTNGRETAGINFSAFYDAWGDPTTCGYAGPCAQDMHIDVGNDGYRQPFQLDGSFSAYVSDHSLHLQNFAFHVTPDVGGGVPEPASWALMISGFGLAGASLRRRRAIAA